VRPTDSGRVVVGLLLLALQSAGSPTAPPGQRTGVKPPEGASFSGDSFDPLVEDGIRRGVYPGAALVVGRRDTILFAKGYGHLAWSASSPAVDPDSSMYDLASLTKVVATTTSLMLLVERGQVRLDEPVSTYIAELKRPETAAITVRQLLTHTSGLRADIPDPELKAIPDSAALMARVLRETPRVAPGTRVIYSDLNAILLGEVVRRVAGEPLDAFVTREVLVPLGLHQTMFRPPSRMRPRIAPTGVWHGHPVAGIVNDGSAFKLRGVSGNAGVFSTAVDVARFAQFVLRGGTDRDGRRLLREAEVVVAVPVAQLILLTELGELLGAVLPDRVEQAVARDGAVDLRRDQRFRDQIGKAVDDFRRRDLRACHDRTGRLQAEHTSKDRQATQDRALGLGQQLVAPVERRPQRLVPRQRRAAAARQQVQTIIEAGR